MQKVPDETANIVKKIEFFLTNKQAMWQIDFWCILYSYCLDQYSSAKHILQETNHLCGVQQCYKSIKSQTLNCKPVPNETSKVKKNKKTKTKASEVTDWFS